MQGTDTFTISRNASDKDALKPETLHQMADAAEDIMGSGQWAQLEKASWRIQATLNATGGRVVRIVSPNGDGYDSLDDAVNAYSGAGSTKGY